MAVHTPNVYSSVVSFCAATTAQRPMTREMMSLSCSGDVSSEGFRGYTRRRTMWKASAVRAREWARKPTMSSRRKKAVSIMSITLMRVLLDHAHLEEPAMTRAKSARARACVCCSATSQPDETRTDHVMRLCLSGLNHLQLAATHMKQLLTLPPQYSPTNSLFCRTISREQRHRRVYNTELILRVARQSHSRHCVKFRGETIIGSQI